MGTRTAFASALTAIGALLVLAQAAQWNASASFSPIVADAGRCAVRIVAAGPASTSGLRSGDIIALDKTDAAARMAIALHFAHLHGAPNGSIVQLPIERAHSPLSVAYRFERDDGPGTFLAELAFKVVIFAIGTFVLWKGRGASAAWLGVWCVGIAVALPDGWWGGGPAALRFSGSLLNTLVWTCLPFALYMVVESFVTSVSARVRWAARALLALSLLPALVTNVFEAVARVWTGCGLVGLNPTFVNATFVGTQLIVLVYFAIGYVGTTGVDRLRLRWVFWAFALSRIGVLLNLVNRLLPDPLELSGIEWLTIVLFPLGCAYAILRHRIIDVNFVLNRTLLYTVLTSLVVGTFVLIEHVVSSVAVGRGIGLVLDALVALGIGVSFNVLHKRVEEMIDRTLFRPKYEAATRLQQLAEEAAYVESADALIQRAVLELTDAVGATGAALYERTSESYELSCNGGLTGLPERVDADDAAFVRLRKRLSQVDLTDVSSALGSDAIAFALVVRGQLIGAFLCGRRKNGETYAPDEIATIRSAIHEVGVELAAIRSREKSDLLNALLTGKTTLEQLRLTP